MARIRTIKPEFWTDEKIVLLPFEARLLFIALWNFADDEGYLVYSPERLKMQIFPNEIDLEMDALIDLLNAAGLVDYYIDSAKNYLLYICHWERHQKIDRPTKTKLSPEKYNKKSISPLLRREIAIKYGCPPGGKIESACYYCGQIGIISWCRTTKKQPVSWISFSGLELDNFVSERAGAVSSLENIVLSCRHCNRSENTLEPLALLGSAYDSSSPREFHRALETERKGKERKGSDLECKQEVYTLVNGKPSTPSEIFPKSKKKEFPSCPYQQILEEFGKILPELPQPSSLSDGRKKHILARWKENADIGYFLQVFHGVQQSDFLMGRRADKNQRQWRASFDWIMTARNWEKIVDGNYDNK